MKTLASTMILALTLTLPVVYAAQNDHSGQKGAGSGMSMGQGMMDQSAMQERMRKMHETMQTIRNTEDQDERRRLMQEHMQQMHEAMGGMGGMMGKGPGHKKMKEMSAEQRQQMMQQRMDMMQGMMQQMMEHMQEHQSMPQGH
jgi:hypothetical protein